MSFLEVAQLGFSEFGKVILNFKLPMQANEQNHEVGKKQSHCQSFQNAYEVLTLGVLAQPREGQVQDSPPTGKS